jgi:hypothetical protein
MEWRSREKGDRYVGNDTEDSTRKVMIANGSNRRRADKRGRSERPAPVFFGDVWSYSTSPAEH